MTSPRTPDLCGDSGVDAWPARRAQDNPAPLSESLTATPVAQLWRRAVAKSKAESAARRARVLAHDDLAEHLKDPPLRLTDPTRWSGWIPPRTLAEEACAQCENSKSHPACRGWPHPARANDSPVRRQLVDIAAEAKRREQAGAT